MASEPGGMRRIDPPVLNPEGIILPTFQAKLRVKYYVKWSLITTNE